MLESGKDKVNREMNSCKSKGALYFRSLMTKLHLFIVFCFVCVCVSNTLFSKSIFYLDLPGKDFP